ncbi:MAG: hypothetical protein CMK09_18255 [Ponticaulis sp.]|nr:hypothetical protein [Ponticaulis sp.]|tara:strand:+ start:12323 stop:13729 length:1407 start_codon:yes stop_codon:yes gene_type:complete
MQDYLQTSTQDGEISHSARDLHTQSLLISNETPAPVTNLSPQPAMKLRTRPYASASRNRPQTREEKWEVWSPFISAFCFILMSQAVESFIARQISPALLGKTTLLFTFGLSTVLVGICLAYRPKRFFLLLIANIPFQLYSLYAIASLSWSIYPSETLKSSLTLLAFHQIGMSMAVMLSWRAIWMGLAWAILALTAAGVLIIPIDGLMTEIHPGAFRGLWIEKNSTGEALAIGALACAVTAILDRSPKYFLGMLFLMVMIVAAKSATALFACSAAIAAFMTIEFIRRGPFRFFTGVWILVIIIGIGAFAIMMIGEDVAKLAGRETTFTGRTLIWPSVLRFIEEKFWFGYGFQAFWTDGGDTKQQVMIDAGFEAHNAHNAFFELTIGLGIIGASLVGFAVLRATLQASTALYGVDGIRRTFLPFLILALIISCFESAFGDSAGVAAFVLGVLVPKVAEGACLNRKSQRRR